MGEKAKLSKKAKFDFSDLLSSALRLSFVRVDRDEFLKSELIKKYDPNTVKTAIKCNPAYAGIPVEEINKIAKECITYETLLVSSTSFVLGIPGKLAVIGTVPADITQYFGHILVILQKLAYLYGWQSLTDSSGRLDDKTKTKLTLFLGVMFGVNGAALTVTKIASTAAKSAEAAIRKMSEKQVEKLSKNFLIKLVKRIGEILGVEFSKESVGKAVATVIPVAGGVVSGALTFFSYKPLAENLRKYLAEQRLADVEKCQSEGYIIDDDIF